MYLSLFAEELAMLKSFAIALVLTVCATAFDSNAESQATTTPTASRSSSQPPLQNRQKPTASQKSGEVVKTGSAPAPTTAEKAVVPAARVSTRGAAAAIAAAAKEKAAKATLEASANPFKNMCSSRGDLPQIKASALLTAVQLAAKTDIQLVHFASHQQYIPDEGPVEILVYRKFDGSDSTKTSDKDSRLPVTHYRFVIVNEKAKSGADANKSKEVVIQEMKPAQDLEFYSVTEGAQIWSEAATQGIGGTDFKKEEVASDKTLLRFSVNVLRDNSYPFAYRAWRDANAYLVGCSSGNEPVFYGSIATTVSNKIWSKSAAIAACILFYIFAVFATFYIHKSQRKSTEDNNEGGTNYASRGLHFNPVVLSAGSNGKGSATKLQILFFSLVVFGVVGYIWMLTGHLTGLSNNVLLLMGISGIGSVAAAGAEVSKQRLSFTNWSWLIANLWLPKGGAAEFNRASWKDIVMTNGEFDVYRFQMITFSFLVGMSLVFAGVQLTDLTNYTIPEALLGILGLSQAVYVMGQLVAPPSIADLDKQIDALKDTQKKLRDAVTNNQSSIIADVDIRFQDDQNLNLTRTAYNDYMATWQTTCTMFETTLGRPVPAAARAKDQTPPFTLPMTVTSIDGHLPDGTVGVPYTRNLIASGGTLPYTWSYTDGPTGRSVFVISEDGVMSGTSKTNGTYTITATAKDAVKTSKTKVLTINVRTYAERTQLARGLSFCG